MGKRVLVTGGMGFIGSNFVRHMLKVHSDMEIVNLDKLTYAGNPANLEDVKERMTFVHGDICDAELVDGLMADVDQVVHFAAETHVDRSIQDAGSFVTTDVFGTYTLLDAALRHDVDKFIHISTDEVYGEAVDHPSLETDGLFPKSPYAASKAGADRLAYSYYATFGLPVIITRCSNNYGPYQYPEKLIPLFVTNALEGKKLPVYGHGRNTRDWIHVEDHCRAVDTLLSSKGQEGEIFNVGTLEEKSVLQIAAVILDELGMDEDALTFVDDRKGHVARHAVDAGKLEKTTSWRPRQEFDPALRQTIRWYKDHPEWWKPIKNGDFREYYTRTYAAKGP